MDTYMTSPLNPYKPYPMFQLNAPVVITADVKKCEQINTTTCTSEDTRHWSPVETLAKFFSELKLVTDNL